MTSHQPSDLFELRHAATDRATIVVVPERRMYAIDGVGDERGAAFRFASDTLRTVGELLRRRLHDQGHETRVGPIECAWWIHPEPPSTDVAEAFEDRAAWHWQQMIEIPARAPDEDAEAAIEDARSSAGRALPLVRIIRFAEGRSAQILHVGGPDTVAGSVRRLYDAVAAAGLAPRGHLHEIHIADYDRVPEGRARAILRLPVEG